MGYVLDDLFAYRFYEKRDGPLVSLMHYDDQTVTAIGKKAGVTNIHEIYNNRRLIEDLLLRMFIRAGGRPTISFPYYAAVYRELPENNVLHMRFDEPECICIPMYAFSKDQVSFTYGQSPRAFTRKDNHPTRRKLYMWQDIEKIMDDYPFDSREDTWIEMQIWDDTVLREYYEQKKGSHTKLFHVKERLSNDQRLELYRKYQNYCSLIHESYFFDPSSAHGVQHAKRVLVLTQALADVENINEAEKEMLLYCGAYHDIGRTNHENDILHGILSYKKVSNLKLLPPSFDEDTCDIIRFVIENHQVDYDKVVNALLERNEQRTEVKLRLLRIVKDADTLDRCRFGHVDKFYLTNESSKNFVHFAYQLLQIFKEVF